LPPSAKFPCGLADRVRGIKCVCLTEETVETLYLLVSKTASSASPGYVVRPLQARREKPRVSAFTSANIDKVLTLEPNLVLTFSDLQADIVADHIRRGLNVHAFDHRSRRDGQC
jgi:iron complex transport system substrate-binding protein